jgi:REP element-mobilizing transposase RayT
MTNPGPLQYGCYYHIYNRGINRENIFVEEDNYRYFVKLLANHILALVDVYSYCLLRNHFHLLVRIKSEDEIRTDLSNLQNLSSLPKPSQRFSNLFNAYAKAFNKRNQRTGTLFQRPFGRVEITTNVQLIHLVTYIHQNPEKHGLVENFRDWKNSSYQVIVSIADDTQLRREEVLSWFGGIGGFVEAHHQNYEMQKITYLIDDEDWI